MKRYMQQAKIMIPKQVILDILVVIGQIHFPTHKILVIMAVVSSLVARILKSQ